MKNQEQYNAWLLADNKMNISYSGGQGQNGPDLKWTSKRKINGRGSQHIIKSIAPEQTEVEITFEQPVPTKANYRFDLVALSDTSTQVTWVFEGNSKPYYLLRVSHLLFQLKKRVTRYMQLSLRNMKDQLENNSQIESPDYQPAIQSK